MVHTLRSFLARLRVYVLLRAALAILQRDGFKSLASRGVKWIKGERRYYGGGLSADSSLSYARFTALFEPNAHTLEHQRNEAKIGQRVFSIHGSCSGASLSQWQATLASLQSQTYPHWILHLQNTDEAVYHQLLQQDHRVQNSEPTEDYRIEITPGDSLAPFALLTIASTLYEHPETDVIYSDEDQLDEQGNRTKPLFKPDWSPEMMFSCDLLDGLCVYRNMEIGSKENLHYKLAERAKVIRHIPHILIHRESPRLPPSPDLLRNYLQETGALLPQVTNGFVRWQPRQKRRVSIIIPSRDHARVLERCLTSLFEITTYENFNVIIVDTGSKERATQDLYAKYASNPKLQIVPYTGDFNFSKACNQGAHAADGDLLLFLNNDVEILHHDWLDLMAQWFERNGVGIVGAKLLYPNRRLQHAGIIVGLNGLAAHLFLGEQENVTSIFGSDNWYRNVLAVTGACLMISRQAFDAVGGFDEAYILSYSDVQLGISVYEAGYRIVYTPHVRLIHHESVSRGTKVPRSDFIRANERWRQWLDTIDPYFNPNLTHRSTFPRLRQSIQDTAYHSNAELMSRLPEKMILTIPDDVI